MKILIDIGHPAHVHYFKNFIKVMIEKDHSITITARDKDVTHSLLKENNLEYVSRGKGSSGFFGKLFYIPKGDSIVYKIAKQKKIDLFLSFASPYASHAAFLLRKPHIAFDDTEVAKFGQLMYRPFTSVFVNPTSFRKNFKNKQIRFNGFIELCHLHPRYFTPDEKIYEELNIEKNKKYSVVRFVSWEANHDFGHHGYLLEKKLEIVSQLLKFGNVFISSEGELPESLEQYRLKIAPNRIHDVLAFADIYIGEGATMASECAMIGVPALYINAISAGTIEEQQKLGLLEQIVDPDILLMRINEILGNPKFKEELLLKRNQMLQHKIDVTAFMVWLIENYPESVKIMRENPDYQLRFQ